MKFFYFCLGVIMLLSCNRKHAEDLGLKTIELEEQIEIKDSSYERIIDFKPNSSSARMRFRLFYYDLNYQPYRSDSLLKAIITTLNGFKFDIIDAVTLEKLSSYNVELGRERFRYSFNENERHPLSLEIPSRVKIESGRLYRIVLTVPPKRDVDVKITSPTFVVGIGHDVFL